MTSIFNFQGQPLRHLMIEGEPWFVARDTCTILGMKTGPKYGSTNQYLRHLETDEKKLVVRGACTPPEAHTLFLGKRSPSLTLIAESGLYKLIMRSAKPEAKEFQNWVTKEVLPSIRKTGGYLLNEAARETAHADTKEAMPLPEENTSIP